MLNGREGQIVTWLVTVFSLIAIPIGIAGMQEKTSTPKPQNKLALGADEVKQLLLLMDTDKNGKISKQEYMSFMEAECDRLDKDKSGELAPKELAGSRL
jgi:hypothetical protein